MKTLSVFCTLTPNPEDDGCCPSAGLLTHGAVSNNRNPPSARQAAFPFCVTQNSDQLISLPLGRRLQMRVQFRLGAEFPLSPDSPSGNR